MHWHNKSVYTTLYSANGKEYSRAPSVPGEVMADWGLAS